MNETIMTKVFLLMISLVLFVFFVLGGADTDHLNLLEERLSLLERDRITLEEKNHFLRAKIDGLSGSNMDYDLLEEQARGVLHYTKPGDILLREMELLP